MTLNAPLFSIPEFMYIVNRAVVCFTCVAVSISPSFLRGFHISIPSQYDILNNIFWLTGLEIDY